MRSKSIISLILCAVMLLCMLVSCDIGGKDAATTSGDGTTDAPKDSVSDTVPESTEPGTDNRGFPNDNLPDKRFNDVVSILTWSNQIAYEFDSDKETGEPIKDVVFYRKRHLKDTYGIELDVKLVDCSPENTKAFLLALSAMMNESSGSYDVVGAPMFVAGSAASKGIFEDLTDRSHAPYVDLSKPWWNEAVVEESKIGGRLYTVTGDITPTFYRGLSLCVINNNLWGDIYDQVDVCDLVNNKEWTYDRLMMVVADAAGLEDGVIPITLDSEETIDGIFTSAGFGLLEHTKNGDIALSELSRDEDFLTLYKFGCDALKSDAVVISSHTEAMINKKSLVHFGDAAQMEYLFKNGLSDYRIAPYPMYTTAENAKQAEYKSAIGLSTTFYGIPACADHEIASFTLEALASYGYRWLTPTWFEGAINGRPDVEHGEMLVLIKRSATLELGYTFSESLSLIGVFRECAKGNSDWASYVGGKVGDWNSAIKEINSKLC